MDFALLLHFTRAVAIRTAFLDHFARTGAVRTGTAIHNTAEWRILNDFLLPAAVTDAACFRMRSRLRAIAVTCITAFCTWNLNVCFLAEYSFLELDRHRILQVIAALWRIWIATSAATAEEHIEDIAKAAKISTACSTAEALIRIDMTKAVIGRTLLVVAEHIVSFLDFLELLLGVFCFVDIRMVLSGQLPV